MGDDKRLLICRLCLCGDHNLTNVFEGKEIQGCSLIDVVTELLSDEVSSDDIYPQCVCANCVEKLTDFKKFKDKCTAHRKLLDRAYYIKHASSDIITTTELSPRNLTEEEWTLRTLEVIAANITPVEPKEEVLSNVSDSEDERLSCISEWEEVTKSPSMETVAENCGEDVQHNEYNNVDSVPHSIEKEAEMALAVERDPESEVERYVLQNHEKQSENEFVCNECHECFVDNESLTSHLSGHVTALACDVVMSNKRKRKISHNDCRTVESSHENDASNNFGCDECRRVFVRLGEIEDHSKRCGMETKFPCPVCPEISFHKCALHDHLKKKHSDCIGAIYDCTDCGFSNVPSVEDTDVPLSSEDSKKESSSREVLYTSVIQPLPQQSTTAPSSSDSPVGFADVPSDSDHYDPKNQTQETPNEPPSVQPCDDEILAGLLDASTRRKRKNEILVCIACGKSYKNRYTYRAHVRSHVQGRIYKCTHCSKSYCRKNHLTAHMKVHGDDEYVCEVCSVVYKNKYLYKMHQATHRGRNFKCDVCGKTYMRKPELTQHKRVHDKSEILVCDICGKIYDTYVLFRKHRYQHKVLSEGKFTCSECGKRKTCQHDLNVHMKSHETKVFHCPLCKVYLPNKMSLKYHMERHEGGVETGMLSCEQCEKTFATAGTLERHKKLSHLGIKEYKCHLCSREYTQKHNLDLHLKNSHH